MNGNLFRVKNVSTYQTLAATALDGRTLADSASILIFQVSDVSQTGVRFANQERTILEKTSTGRLLLRKAKAEIELKLKRPMTVTACNMMGEPVGTVNSTFRSGVLRFTADNSAYKGGAVAYHLTPAD